MLAFTKYMSSKDGSERKSNKKLFEGDKEITHMCMRIDRDEAYVVFEERRSGVNMAAVITYLNKHLRQYLQSINYKNMFILWAGQIPSDDFLALLQNAKKLTVAELHVEKEILGSGYYNLLQPDDNSQDDIIMTIKSKPRQSLTTNLLKKAFLKITSEGSKIKRIRVYGKDHNNMNILMDSLNGKKQAEIIVELEPDGTVDSYSIFSKIEDILGVTE